MRFPARGTGLVRFSDLLGSGDDDEPSQAAQPDDDATPSTAEAVAPDELHDSGDSGDSGDSAGSDLPDFLLPPLGTHETPAANAPVRDMTRDAEAVEVTYAAETSETAETAWPTETPATPAVAESATVAAAPPSIDDTLLPMRGRKKRR